MLLLHQLSSGPIAGLAPGLSILHRDMCELLTLHRPYTPERIRTDVLPGQNRVRLTATLRECIAQDGVAPSIRDYGSRVILFHHRASDNTVCCCGIKMLQYPTENKYLNTEVE